MAPKPRHRPSPWIAVLVVPVIVAIALSTFTWSAANLEPRDLPLGVAGPAQATGPVEAKLTERKGAFDVHRYADAAAARKAIEDREVYGAVVAAPDGQTLLIASAASPTVAGLLRENLAARQAKVLDVVPADPDDPRGAAFGSMLLPLVLAGIIGGVIVALLGPGGLSDVGILAATAAATGLVTIVMVQGWLDVIEGPWLLNAGVIALAVLAIASVIAGLKVLGPAGIALGALVMVFVGNPWSGITSAPELLPKAAGFIGQLLPPGAGGNLLRNTAFFDGAGSGGQLAVLLVWTVLGLGAIMAGAAMRRRRTAATS
jgi:ABC-2 family transporter